MKKTKPKIITPLNILVGCEESQAVANSFRAIGHNAFSCDLKPCSGGHPEYHLKMDVLLAINGGRLLLENGNSVFIKKWDMGIFFPDCFSSDMLVLSKDGYKKISEIKIGDMVLTHRGRWRPVTSVMSRPANKTITVKVTGSLDIVTTPEHPFLSRTRVWGGLYKNKRIKTETPPDWKKAEELKTFDLIGSVLPPCSKEVNISDENLWLMGLYLADGSLRVRRNKYESVFFSIGNNKANEFKEKVKRKYHQRIIKSVSEFSMHGYEFCKTFAQFGRSAATKLVPGWVIRLPYRQAKIFLDGYLFGDGHYGSNRVASSSISKPLTLGIAILMRKVYKKPVSVQLNKRKPTTIIEGRLVNQSNSYTAHFHTNKNKKTISTIDGKYTWYPFRKTKPSESCMVYNISVLEDESYMVNQCIVHNCTYLTVSANKWYKDQPPRKSGVLVGAERRAARKKAIEFVKKLYNCDIPRVAIENPIGVLSTEWMPPTQVIQPWMYGHGETKATCLWLKRLPRLNASNVVEGREGKVWKMPPTDDRAELRSKTFPGIAAAFADQWSYFK